MDDLVPQLVDGILGLLPYVGRHGVLGLGQLIEEARAVGTSVRGPTGERGSLDESTADSKDMELLGVELLEDVGVLALLEVDPMYGHGALVHRPRLGEVRRRPQGGSVAHQVGDEVGVISLKGTLADLDTLLEDLAGLQGATDGLVARRQDAEGVRVRRVQHPEELLSDIRGVQSERNALYRPSPACTDIRCSKSKYLYLSVSAFRWWQCASSSSLGLFHSEGFLNKRLLTLDLQ